MRSKMTRPMTTSTIMVTMTIAQLPPRTDGTLTVVSFGIGAELRRAIG